MSRLSDSKNGVVRPGLGVPVPQVKNLRLIMPLKTAFALIFCFSASLLFAQEQAAKKGSDRVKDAFERAMVQAESATAVSHQLKDVFERAFFFFSSRRRHTRSLRDWSSDVCSSD